MPAPPVDRMRLATAGDHKVETTRTEALNFWHWPEQNGHYHARGNGENSRLTVHKLQQKATRGRGIKGRLRTRERASAEVRPF